MSDFNEKTDKLIRTLETEATRQEKYATDDDACVNSSIDAAYWLNHAIKEILTLQFRLECEATEARRTIENLTHNLRVETEARDRFYEEVKEKSTIIYAQQRKLDAAQETFANISETMGSLS
jgi:hypothetical protein